MSPQSIIPKYIDRQTREGRMELRYFLRDFFKQCDKKDVKAFTLRAALRRAWRLEELKVSDKSKLDRFYFYWVRAITTASAVVFSENNENFGLAAAYDAVYATDAYGDNNAAAVAYATSAATSVDAYAAYAYADVVNVIILNLESDLSCLKNKTSLITQPLWLPEKEQKTLPKLEALNPFWSKNLFTPAINGTLFNKENHLFFKGFLSLNEKIFEQKSAEAMRISIEAYIEANGDVSTTQVARLILLGNGGAGKTSLVNKFCDPKNELVVSESPTPRIQVRDHIIKDKDGKETELNIWDFGGQVIMHSTHSFFLSERSTYIVACNSRANEQPDAWLQLLQSRLSSNRPMQLLIVYTHCDQNQLANKAKAPWRRDKALRRAFPDFVLNFYNVDLQPEVKGGCSWFCRFKKSH